jgi:hypothetical protein
LYVRGKRRREEGRGKRRREEGRGKRRDDGEKRGGREEEG